MADKKTRPATRQEDVCKQALERYQRWYEREQENVRNAYDDLEFKAGFQWHDADKNERENEGRPILTINQLPKFIRQVTGDMRQMKPSIRPVPVDSRGDKDTAETLGGMIRYIENRSDAAAAYMTGAESQVSAGIGHWQVVREYASETTFNQELRITGIDDGVAVAWDPDAVLPSKEDAKWCIVPVDMSRDAFEENYPEFAVEDFDTIDDSNARGWFTEDSVRVAVYWCKKPIKRTLALMPDGVIDDLTTDENPEEKAAALTAQGARVEKRDGFKVMRYLITASHILEESEWPGVHIPVVPVKGEEVRIGRKVVWYGLVRWAKDSQRMYNYMRSAEAEVTALQPKAPFMATERNVEKYREMWDTANSKNWPALIFTPDPANGGIAPQRVQPPVSSQGISEGLALSVEEMKSTMGIYDASLGNKSNETSGKAILARQREGDVGTYVYIDNWIRGIRRTGEILIDLIPHVYDTERQIRIMGEDGKVDLKWINRPVGMQVQGPDGDMQAIQQIENDVTVGAYDVVMEAGPSYTTKREQAKESMQAFVQAVPQAAPVVMDLYAKAQDWPMADEIGKRLEAIAPPQIQKLIAKQKQEQGDEEQPDQPTPQEQQQAQFQQAAVQLELENKQLTNDKIKAEIQKIMSEIGQPGQQPQDPLMPIKVQREQTNASLDAEKGAREVAILDQRHSQEQIKTAQMADQLEKMRQGMVQDAEKHTLNVAQGLQQLNGQENSPDAG